jgi:hypothetical protein
MRLRWRILGGVAAMRHDLDGLGDRLAGHVAVGAFPAALAVVAASQVIGSPRSAIC